MRTIRSPAVRLSGAGSHALRPLLAGPARLVRWLGSVPTAIYLATDGQPGVLAVLSRDAVRLPCGIVLPTTSAEMPLDTLAIASRPCRVGGGQIVLAGSLGTVVIGVAREWAPNRVARGAVDAVALSHVRTALRDVADRVETDLVTPPAQAADSAAWVARLLGRGPGLTPSGDDVLAGFLVGASAFGVPVSGISSAVTRLAPIRTTALSATLLWHAARGECVPELAALAEALRGNRPAEPVASQLFAVGHSSGAALAHGMVLAAQRSLESQAAA